MFPYDFLFIFGVVGAEDDPLRLEMCLAICKCKLL